MSTRETQAIADAVVAIHIRAERAALVHRARAIASWADKRLWVTAPRQEERHEQDERDREEGSTDIVEYFQEGVRFKCRHFVFRFGQCARWVRKSLALNRRRQNGQGAILGFRPVLAMPRLWHKLPRVSRGEVNGQR